MGYLVKLEFFTLKKKNYHFYFGDLKIILFNLYVSREREEGGGYNGNFEGVGGVLISLETVNVFLSFYNF